MKARFDKNAKIEVLKYNDEIIEMIYLFGYPQDKYDNAVDFITSVMKLMEANSKIWQLEASIRQEYSTDDQAKEVLSMAEIGRRALAIRDLNKLRNEAKKEIDMLYGEITDNKVDHASSE